MKNKKVIILVIFSFVLVILGLLWEVSSDLPTQPTITPKPNKTPDATPIPEGEIITYTRYSCTQGIKKMTLETSKIECEMENKYTFTVLEEKIIDPHMIIVYKFQTENDYNNFLNTGNLEGTRFERTKYKEELKVTETAFFSLPTTDGSLNNFTDDYIDSIEQDGYNCTIIERENKDD